MSTDDGPRRGTQRSVAELLAAYSAETPQAPARRRPEQAPPPPPEPPAPTAGYPAPGPETGTGYTPSYGGADPYGYPAQPSYGGPPSDPGYGYGGPASDPGHGASTGYVPPPAPGGYGSSPYGASPYPAPAPTAYTPAPPPPAPQAPPPQAPPPQAPTAYTPAPPPPQVPAPQAPPPQAPPPGWGTAGVPSPAAPPSPQPSPPPPGIADGGPPTSASAFVDHDDDSDDDGFYRVDERDRPGPVAPGGGGTAMLAAPDAAPAGLDDDRDDFDDLDDEYDDEAEYDDAPRSGVREWAILVAQLLAGAVLGAVLWTVFSFLWGSVPIVALVLALAATTGLVFGVRALRRSDDLQTTLLAVFVGLVVTVSPATVALLGN